MPIKQTSFDPVQTQSFRPEGSQSEVAGLVEGLSPLAAKAAQALNERDRTKAEGALTESFQKIGEAVDLAGAASAEGATFDPNTGDILTDVGELTPEVRDQFNRVMKESESVFRGIASAVGQGAIPSNAAALHTESELKRMINQNPGYSRELRALARDLAGYDPSNYALRQILKTRVAQSGPMSQEDKWRDQARALTQAARIEGRMDVTEDQMYVLIARDAELQFRQSIANNQLEANEITATEYIQDFEANIGPRQLKLLANIAKQRIENGGIIDENQIKDQLRVSKQTTRTELLTNFSKTGRVLSLDTRKKIDASLDRIYADLTTAINENGFSKILKDKIERVVLVDKMWGITATRELSRFTNAHGERITSQVLDMMAGFASPAQFELFARNFPQLKLLIDAGELTTKAAGKNTFTTLDKMLRGLPLTEEDRKYRAAAEALAMVKAPTEVRDKFFNNMGRDNPVRGVKWLAKAGQRPLSSPTQVKFMKQEFNTDYDKIIVNISTRLDSDKNLKLVEKNGKLQLMKSIVLRDRVTDVNVSDDDLDKMNTWFDAVNNGWSGDLGVDKNTFLGETRSIINGASSKEE